MKVGLKSRIMLVCYAMAVVFSLFSYRLIMVQHVQHDKFAELAARKHVSKQIIHASRGRLLDVHGEVLADNIPAKRVVADASHIRRPEELADLLAPRLGMGRGELLEKFAEGRRYIVLRKSMPELEADALRQDLRARGLRGIYFEHTESRIYPNGSMLCHVLGFINHEMRGMDGVERTMDRYLAGEDGYRYIEHDRTGREIVLYRGQERQPKDGCDVHLTIDMGLQQIVESELDGVVEKYAPRNASIIVMRPQTGEILAMGNRPHYDLGELGGAGHEDMKNRSIINMVEPGSTFKIVAAGAALNEGLVQPETMVFCENGRFRFGGSTLRDHHPYGDLTVSDILVKSSNIGSAKLAIQLGDVKFHEYVRRFGFGTATGIDLPGEIGGMVHPPHRWSRISITRIPMGHEIGVTPLQMVAAMSVIANGGVLVRPHVVERITDGEGRIVAGFPPKVVRRVLSRETAARVSRALADVVSDRGTARRAQVPPFRVAGKTGTAQKVDPNGGYAEGKYVVSFLGYLPEGDPEFVCLVIVDDPVTEPGACYGGTVAAPVFASLAHRAVRYLDLEPPFIDVPGGVLPQLTSLEP